MTFAPAKQTCERSEADMIAVLTLFLILLPIGHDVAIEF
jgi:hypothetical protein